MSRRRKTKAKTKTPRQRSRGEGSGLGSAMSGAWGKVASFDWHVIRRSGAGIAWIACIGGLSAAWFFSVPRLQAYASQRESVDPHDVNIRFLNPPGWFKSDIANTLLRTAYMHAGGDPTRREDLVQMRLALLETGWFEGIRQIRRVDNDAIEIDAQFVHEYTAIRDEQGDHLVDDGGRLLPLTLPRGDRKTRIAISGAHFPRPTTLGHKWEGADVQAGLKMLRLLENQPWRTQIAEIDVAAYLSQSIIRLKTTGGSTIIWGGAPGEEPALEVLAEGKLARLSYLYQHHGRIDGGNEGEVDITGQKAVVVRGGTG